MTAIHNLQDDEDLRINALNAEALHALAEQHRMRYVRTPIQDGSADDVAARLVAALADLDALIKGGDRVYLHCNAGLNRAPTLAIAWLRGHGGMSLNEALAHVKKRRACGPFMTVLEEHFGPRDLQAVPSDAQGAPLGDGSRPLFDDRRLGRASIYRSGAVAGLSRWIGSPNATFAAPSF